MTQVIQSLAFIIIARYLGNRGLGQYSVVFAYLSFFQITAGLGVDSLVIRELSINDRHETIIGNAILLKLAASFLSILLSTLIVSFCGYEHILQMYICIASLSLFFSFGSTFAGLFQHHMKTLYYSLPEMIVSILAAMAMVIAAVKGSPLWVLVMTNAFSVPLVAIIYWLLCVKKLRLRPTLVLDPVLSRTIIRNSWPILFSALFVVINTRIDQVLLYRLKGDAEVGIYAAAVRLTEFFSFVPIAFSTIMFPFMCDSYNRSRDKFVFVYRRAFKYMAIIIIPLAFGTSLLAKPIVNVVYGADFPGSATILAALIWSQIFVFLGCINANILIILNLQKVMFYLTLAGAVANIAINLWLIPKYSGLGAAISTVISYSFVGILLQCVLRETRNVMHDYLVAIIKPALASIIMSCGVYILMSINIGLAIFTGVATYCTMMLLIKGIDSVDIDYIRQIVLKTKCT